MQDSRDFDAAMNALASVQLFIDCYGKTPQAFEGISKVLAALDPSNGSQQGGANIRVGVASAIREHFGLPT